MNAVVANEETLDEGPSFWDHVEARYTFESLANETSSSMQPDRRLADHQMELLGRDDLDIPTKGIGPFQYPDWDKAAELYPDEVKTRDYFLDEIKGEVSEQKKILNKSEYGLGANIIGSMGAALADETNAQIMILTFGIGSALSVAGKAGTSAGLASKTKTFLDAAATTAKGRIATVGAGELAYSAATMPGRIPYSEEVGGDLTATDLLLEFGLGFGLGAGLGELGVALGKLGKTYNPLSITPQEASVRLGNLNARDVAEQAEALMSVGVKFSDEHRLMFEVAKDMPGDVKFAQVVREMVMDDGDVISLLHGKPLDKPPTPIVRDATTQQTPEVRVDTTTPEVRVDTLDTTTLDTPVVDYSPLDTNQRRIADTGYKSQDEMVEDLRVNDPDRYKQLEDINKERDKWEVAEACILAHAK